MAEFDWLIVSWVTCANEALVTQHLIDKEIISGIVQTSEHLLGSELKEGEKMI